MTNSCHSRWVLYSHKGWQTPPKFIICTTKLAASKILFSAVEFILTISLTLLPTEAASVTHYQLLKRALDIALFFMKWLIYVVKWLIYAVLYKNYQIIHPKFSIYSMVNHNQLVLYGCRDTRVITPSLPKTARDVLAILLPNKTILRYSP